jgi:hypothetical protein
MNIVDDGQRIEFCCDRCLFATMASDTGRWPRCPRCEIKLTPDSDLPRPRSARVLELAVAHGPVRYQDLVMSQSPKAVPPKPPRQRAHPPSLARPSPSRPWRQIPNSG